MGRESRLARRPGPIDNQGDLERAKIAGACGLLHLKSDLRVVAQYTAWCDGRDLPRLMRQPVWLPAEIDAAAKALIEAVCRPASATERDAVAQTLQAMGVPCWPWAATQLVSSVFPVLFYNAIQLDPAHQKALEARLAGLVALPRGYLPKEKGTASIRRNVEWWYRARIKEPADSIHALERADASTHPEISRGRQQRPETSRSRVYDGIEQAENLLKRLLDDSAVG